MDFMIGFDVLKGLILSKLFYDPMKLFFFSS